MDFKCKKCGSNEYTIKSKPNGTGTATGLYCAKCGFWHKWLGKEEKRQYEANNGSERDELLQKIEQLEKENVELRKRTTNDQLDARCYGLETIILGLQQENTELKARLEKAVELPCNVGDTIYTNLFGNVRKRWKIIFIHIAENDISFTADCDGYWKFNILNINIKDYNKTWFTEQRLAELKGGDKE